MRNIVSQLIVYGIIVALIYGAYIGITEMSRSISDASNNVEMRNSEIINIMEGDVPADVPAK